MHRLRGFTLVELMAVLVIAAVLAFVATSTWPAYWKRTHRAAAGAALVATLSQLELRHARTGTYATDDSRSPGPTTRADGYTIFPPQVCIGVNGSLPISQCVQVMAVPHTPDPDCSFLALRSTGERIPDDPACWP